MTGPIDYGRLDAGSDCNYWAMDPTLRAVAARAYPDGEFAWAEPILDEFGAACGHGIAERSDRVDRHPPELHTYDADGAVVNEVEYHPDQFETERVVYDEFRLTHDAFHAPPGRDEPASLTHTLAMQTLLSYCDVGFCCPASMTTGAAVALDRADHDREGYFRRLTSADYDDHVEGAMFLTERQGGSDVGANETRAEHVAGDTYELSGEKWFCSNVDAEGALVLARTPDAPDGTAGLSLFLVPHTVDGEPNAKLVRRLKDKLGTLSVPTGEIEFRGATGYLIGEEGQGFRLMTEMMNYERLTNATGAIGVIGRALLEAKVHAANRETFGARLDEHALLRRDLAELTVEYEGAVTFAFEAARWYNEYERGTGSDEAFELMRLLLPVAKHRTARDSVGVASYCMEVLGGNGYVREHVTPRLLRDTQVLPIWEGASNVISLDVLRVLERERAHESLVPFVDDLLAVDDDRLASLADEVRDSFEALRTALATLATEGAEYAQYHAKELTDLIYDVTTAALLLDRADDALDGNGDGDGDADTDGEPDARLALVAEGFVREHLREEPGRGIADGDRFHDEHFDALARYAPVDPASLDGSLVTADD